MPAIMDASKAKQELGWRPRYSSLEALRDTLEGPLMGGRHQSANRSVPVKHSVGGIEMGHLGGSASVEIDAPLEGVWAVVQDVMAAPEWQGSLEEVIALERDADGRPTLVDTRGRHQGQAGQFACPYPL